MKMIYLTWQNFVLIFCLGGTVTAMIIYIVYIFSKESEVEPK